MSLYRYRTRLYSGDDSKYQTDFWIMNEHDKDHPPTYSYNHSDPLLDLYGNGDITDYNNRRDSLYHQSKSIRSGYSNGQSLNIGRHKIFCPPTQLPANGICSGTDKLDYRFGDGYRITGSLAVDARNYLDVLPRSCFVDDDGNFIDPIFSDPYAINSYYARARHDLRPDLPRFQLFRELGELKDVPDQIKDLKHVIENFKSIHGNAKQYLAVQFGWLPLVSSIRQFINLRNNLDKYLKQLLRDNGKPVRRKRNYVTHDKSKQGVTRSFSTGDGIELWEHPFLELYPRLSFYQGFDPNFRITSEYKTSYRVWAFGTSMYQLPSGPHDMAYMWKLTERLANFRITIGQVYDLIPWTWLIDWFTTLGQIVHSFDPGVADQFAYSEFYLMGERLSSLDLTISFDSMDAISGETVNTQATCRHEFVSKLRNPSGPFDYTGDNAQQMSPFQLSILGALGITKFPRVARSI